LTAAVLTVSDRVSRGEADDGSGDLLEQLLRGDGYEVERRVVADERKEIADALRELAAGARLILTTGGTGLAPRDVTPEATRDVLEREAPGIAQALRADSLHHTPYAQLSRGTAGVLGATLIVNPAAAATAMPSCNPRSSMRSTCSPATRPRTSRHRLSPSRLDISRCQTPGAGIRLVERRQPRGRVLPGHALVSDTAGESRGSREQWAVTGSDTQ